MHRVHFRDFRVGQKILQKRRGFLPAVHNRRQRQPPLRPRQRHIEKSPLLLYLEIALGLLLFHQIGRKFKLRPPRSGREVALAQSQNENVRKFQPLRRMHGHQLHRVARQFVLDLHVAVEFVEIPQIFDEIPQLLALALPLPLLHECDQPLQMLLVGLRSHRRNAQIRDQLGQQGTCRRSSRQLPQLSEQFHELCQPYSVTIERRLAMRRFDLIPKWTPVIFNRTLRQSHQLARPEAPVRRRQHPRARHVVRRHRHQPQPGQ